MVAQGGAEGGTLGESTSIQGSPGKGDGKLAAIPSPFQGSKPFELIPRVPLGSTLGSTLGYSPAPLRGFKTNSARKIA
jgi:hypothetical protein